MAAEIIAQCVGCYYINIIGLILHSHALRYDNRNITDWMFGVEAMCSADEFTDREDGAMLGSRILTCPKNEMHQYTTVK